MRLLITGGAGCLGANLIDRYIDSRDMEIAVIDNFATGARASLPEDAANLAIHEGSIADRETVDRLFDEFRPTHVIHSAAAYKDPENWSEDADSNVLGSIYTAKAALRCDVKRFVNFQTALCYGRPNEVPIPIDHPTAPFTSYGISKTAGEQFVLMSRLNAVSLRLANITGPRLSIGPIPTFYTRLKAGKGCFCSDTVRDFMDMDDFFSIMDLALKDDAPTGIFNVSTGEGKSIKDVFDQVVDYLGVTLEEDVPIVAPGDDDVPAVVLDPSETERAFGWKAAVSFGDTIRKMLTWYDEYGVKEVYAHLKKPNLTGEA